MNLPHHYCRLVARNSEKMEVRLWQRATVVIGQRLRVLTCLPGLDNQKASSSLQRFACARISRLSMAGLGDRAMPLRATS
jgi:hypothetical protein